ncbi:MAG: hypothetical protein EP319_14560 [Deltaproteobacteria bacterium]|nr:MAG: hypothetical protein EP319_14560 [Deltaproteobacteria bacterium]
MINSIIELGNKIEDLWSKVGHDETAFPDICYEELADFNNEMSLDDFDSEMADWIQKSSLPTQLNVYNSFGQPPVTVFNNGKFVIDLYFWMHVDTSIHSHSFCGAFKVFFGRSLHEQFSIQPIDIYAPDIMKTKVDRIKTDILDQGSTLRIIQGNDFTHRVIHLETPTITLCARTVTDTTKQQWHHFPNGISIEKKSIPEDVLKKIYFYQYLLQRDEEKGLDFLKDLVQDLSLSINMNLYEQLTMDPMGLEDYAIEPFFNEVYARVGETPWFKEYMGHYQKLQETELDFEAYTPELRFLEHAIINEYTEDETLKYMEKICGDKVSDELLETIKRHF